MARCTVARWWLWYQWGFIWAGFAVGTIALLAAIAVHDGWSFPLLVFGGGWIALSALGRRQSLQVAHEMRIEDGQVTFVRPGGDVRVPAAEVREIGYGPFDPKRVKRLSVTTASQSTIRSAPRMEGLPGFLTALREANPAVIIRL